MEITDKNRKWMWCFLAALLVWNVYIVQQMIAALALFTLALAALGIVIGSLYLLQASCEVVLARVANRLRPSPAIEWSLQQTRMEKLGQKSK